MKNNIFESSLSIFLFSKSNIKTIIICQVLKNIISATFIMECFITRLLNNHKKSILCIVFYLCCV